MSARLVEGLLAGAGVGAGILLLVVGLLGRSEPAGGRRSRRTLPLQRYALGVGAALLVLLLTRWIAVAVALGLVAGNWRQLFGGTRAAATAVGRLEALAGWTESLRDMVATGVALPEALPASAAAASPLIAPQLRTLAERLRAREPLEAALRGLAGELDDVSADLVLAALVLNARAQGRQLHAVLSALARSTRSELAVRRAVEAERRATRRGVQIVFGVTVGTALGLRLLNPDYLQPYHQVTGQLVLAVVVAVFAVGFVWLNRLARIPVPARFLANPGEFTTTDALAATTHLTSSSRRS